MRKLWICLMAVCCLLVSGCSTDTKSEKPKEPEKTETEPVKEEESNKTYEYNGKIIDATSSTFTVENTNKETMLFLREGMKLSGADSLLLEEGVRVTYEKQGDDNIALTCEVKEAAKPVQEEKPQTQPTKSKIDKIIDEMTVEEKVGQMFFVRCPEDQKVSDVNTYHLGGYILFDRDFNGKSYQQVVNNLASYQKKAKVPLLIGVDEEGGTVNRVSNYFRKVPFWSPQALYREGGMSLIRSDTKEKAKLLLNMGINVNLAPDADVSTNSNDFIYRRAFGKDAKQTANYVREVVTVMKNNGIGSCLKHFPGYGNNVDTHTGIAIDKRPYSQFQKSDFLPFEAGIKAGVDSILVSHNIINSMDKKHPASLSAEVHRVLRENLKFKGVIMTDDLAMDAIKEYSDDANAAVTAVKAGNDLLICGNYRQQMPAVIKAVKNKEISEKQINASVRRILEWKQKLGLL